MVAACTCYTPEVVVHMSVHMDAFNSSLRGMRLLSLSHAANEDLIHLQPCVMVPWFEMLDSKMHACAFIGAICLTKSVCGEAGRGM
jgi:hypothetical protein